MTLLTSCLTIQDVGTIIISDCKKGPIRKFSLYKFTLFLYLRVINLDTIMKLSFLETELDHQSSFGPAKHAVTKRQGNF
jgi:hypothetical protein